MGSINKSHNETDGGVLLFSGELILIYCDSVNIEVGGKESSKGRIYLTTHRIIFVATPMRANAVVKSVSCPFFALSEIKLEQPVFGANYISARVRDESDQSQSFFFKLKFSKGGAIEFAMAMSKAADAVSQIYNPAVQPQVNMQSPSMQYYQAPPTVYAPGYNCGFQMPQSQHFSQPGAAPIGFIYASDLPPPYPGMGPQGQPQQQPPAGGPSHQQGTPGQQPPYGQPGHHVQPHQAPYGQPSQGPYGQPPHGPYGQPQQQGPYGHPQQQGPYGHPQQGPYGQQHSQSQPYPQPGQGNQPAPSAGFQPPPSYESSGASQTPQAPQAPQGQADSSSSPAYPSLNPAEVSGNWPTAPSFNPNWPSEDKKDK